MSLKIPDTTYLMRAGDETLVAESLDELAELAELALAHGEDPPPSASETPAPPACGVSALASSKRCWPSSGRCVRSQRPSSGGDVLASGQRRSLQPGQTADQKVARARLAPPRAWH